MDSEVDIVDTKLVRPPLVADLLVRERLFEDLESGKRLPAVLVSAPAGFGKSTLISSWLERIEWRSAWLSLDPGDEELHRFVAYLVSAVRKAVPGACARTLELLGAPRLPPLPAVVGALANDLNTLEEPLILVLDDYHHVSSGSQANELFFGLLAHPPIPLHLVIATRRDPAGPLAVMRARGQLLELRTRDLLFTRAETHDFFAGVLEVSLQEDAIEKLQAQLEGWPAGLRLAALAMRHADDPNALANAWREGNLDTRAFLLQ